jgi:outer membrane protein OmpA-like peptidoglycan-associated protein
MEAPAAAVRTVREPSSGIQEFVVLYQFDDDRANVEVVNQAAVYARKSGGRVKVTGSRATSLLSDGRRLVEREGLAERRANSVAAVLRGLGVSNVAVEAAKEAAPADGQTDASRRRVVIAVVPVNAAK